jgi:hypothetical protein
LADHARRRILRRDGSSIAGELGEGRVKKVIDPSLQEAAEAGDWVSRSGCGGGG